MSGDDVLSAAVIEELAIELAAMGERKVLIVCGGTVVWLRHGLRGTNDLEPLSPAHDGVLNEAARRVHRSGKFQLSEDWLNYQTVDETKLQELLPDGWAERALVTEPIFPIRPSLVIYGLCHDDFVRSKMLAAVASVRFGRHRDDLKVIASREDIESNLGWLAHVLAFLLGKSQYTGKVTIYWKSRRAEIETTFYRMDGMGLMTHIFHQLLEQFRDDLHCIGFSVSDALRPCGEPTAETVREILERVARADCTSLAAIDLFAAWMAKRGESQRNWIATLALDSSLWCQYLAASWEIGRGDTLPVPQELVGCRRAGCAADDPVFDFHEPDVHLDRRGFLSPTVRPAFAKVA